MTKIREALWQVRHAVLKTLSSLGYSQSLSVDLSNQLTARRCSVAIDVGANRGNYGALLRRIGFKGRIISAEPIASTFALLTARAARDQHWHVLNVAVGDAEGEIEMKVMSDDSFCSALTPNEYGREAFPVGTTVVKTATIPLTTVTDILSNHEKEFPCERVHLKSDTQGFDMHVLRGAAKKLNQIHSIQLELSMSAIYLNQPNYLEQLEFLAQNGFSLSAIHPVTRKADFALIEADGLFVRDA